MNTMNRNKDNNSNLNSVFYAQTYHPIQAGSINGTDILPHDNAVYRALLCSSAGLYDPLGDPNVIGEDPYCTVFVCHLSHLTTEDTLRKAMSNELQIFFTTTLPLNRKKASLQAISSESSSSTQGSVSSFSNDDYSQVKGPEKRGYIRCVGRMPTIKKVASSTRNPDPTVEELKAVVGAMAKIIQENIQNSNLLVLSNLNIKMRGSTSSAESHHNGSG